MDIQAATRLRDVVAEEGPLSMSTLAVKVEWGKGTLAELGNIRKFLIDNKEIFKLVGTKVHLSDKLQMFAKQEDPADKALTSTEKAADSAEEKLSADGPSAAEEEAKDGEKADANSPAKEPEAANKAEEKAVSKAASKGWLDAGHDVPMPEIKPKAVGISPKQPTPAQPKLAGAGIRVAPPVRPKKDATAKAASDAPTPKPPLISPLKRPLQGASATASAAKKLVPSSAKPAPPASPAPKASGSYIGGRLGLRPTAPAVAPPKVGGLRFATSSAAASRSAPYVPRPAPTPKEEPLQEEEPFEEEEYGEDVEAVNEEEENDNCSFVGSCWGVVNHFNLAGTAPGAVAGAGFNEHGEFTVSGKVTTTGYRLEFKNGEDLWPVTLSWSPDGLSLYGLDSKLKTEAYFEVVLEDGLDQVTLQDQLEGPDESAETGGAALPPWHKAPKTSYNPKPVSQLARGNAATNRTLLVKRKEPETNKASGAPPQTSKASGPAPQLGKPSGPPPQVKTALQRLQSPQAAKPGIAKAGVTSVARERPIPSAQSGDSPAAKAEPTIKPRVGTAPTGGAAGYRPGASAARPIGAISRGPANGARPVAAKEEPGVAGSQPQTSKGPLAPRAPGSGPRPPIVPKGPLAPKAPTSGPRAPLAPGASTATAAKAAGTSSAASSARAPVAAKSAAGTQALRTARAPVAPKFEAIENEDNLVAITTKRLGAAAGRLATLLKDVGCTLVADFRGMLTDVPVEELCSALLEADSTLDRSKSTQALTKMATMVGHKQ